MSPPPATGPRSPARATLEQLHVFLAVARREHVTAAADALGISQGSVSGLVARLEDALGLPLFRRVGRNVRLTDVGRALIPLAEQVVEDIGRIERLCAGFHAVQRGELTVACGRVVGAHRVSGWLAPFVHEHPEIAMHLTLAPLQQLVDMLLSGDADVIITGSSVEAAGVEWLALERTEMVLVVAAGHPLAAAPDPLRHLHRYRHLVHESGTATELRAAELLRGVADRSERAEMEEGALHAALLAGLGYAAMPRAVVEQDVASGRLRMLPRPGKPVTQVFTAARRLAQHPPAQEAFWSHLATIAAPEPGPVQYARASSATSPAG